MNSLPNRSRSTTSLKPLSLNRTASNQSHDYRSERLTPLKSQGEMALFGKSLAGPGYIILNLLRSMNIIGLLFLATASIILLIKMAIVTNFFFFDALSHVVTAIISIFLTVSELSVFKHYFRRNWPLLSSDHGFVGLGSAMLVLGINTLGNLNKPASTPKAMGQGFWRIVVSAGIIIFVLGFVNIFASYIFRTSTPPVTAREIRSHGAVALSARITQASEFPSYAPSSGKALSIITASSKYSTPSSSPITPRRPEGSRTARAVRAARESLYWPARQYRAAPARMGMRDAPPLPTHVKGLGVKTQTTGSSDKKPPYPESPVAARSGSDSKKRDKVKEKLAAPKKKDKASAQEMRTVAPMEISAPMNVNPQFAHLIKRPDTTYHPAKQSTGDGSEWV